MRNPAADGQDTDAGAKDETSKASKARRPIWRLSRSFRLRPLRPSKDLMQC